MTVEEELLSFFKTIGYDDKKGCYIYPEDFKTLVKLIKDFIEDSNGKSNTNNKG